MRVLFSLLILMNSVSVANAAEIYEQNQSIRSMGMGGAYLTTVSDTDALFYNPAALAKLSGLSIRGAGLQLGVNGADIYDIVKDNPDLTKPASYEKFFGKNVWIKGGAKSAIAVPYFGVAAYTDNTLKFQLHNPAYPEFNTHFISDYGFIVGGATKFGDDLSFGMNLKRINRWGGDEDVGVGTITSGGGIDALKNKFKNKGVGYGMDAALMYTAPTPFKPSVAFVWQDIGQTSFLRTEGTMAPPAIHDNFSLGFGTMVDLPGFDWATSLDLKHLTESEEQLGKKIHLGTEFSLPMIDLRAGINQGYTTYGVGLNFLLIHFDAAYYGEELGVYPGQSVSNRIQVGVSIDLSFDVNFKFTDNSGRSRKLKQRR